jgi:hypothetical protein
VDDKEPFLSRWSRRKLEAKENTPVALAPAQLPAAAPGAPPVPAVPAAEPATPGSPQGGSAEYRQFFDPQVDEKLRQTALRGLFSDPHFNVMDGLDTYIDDYSLADPIPAAMLRQLNQAKALFLFDDEKKSVESEGGPAAPAGTAASPMAAADTSAIPEPPPTSASDEVVEAATGAVAAVPVEGSRNN